MRRLTAQSGLLALTIALCAAGLSGCANCRMPQLYPTGQSSLVSTTTTKPLAAFRDTPPTNRESNRVELILCPHATVAPIGSEIILLAGVRGPDQYLRTNERVEWMIDPGSVGQFVDLDKGSWTDPFVGDFTRAKKIDNTFAVNTTSRRLLRLTRGTPDSSDDMEVLKGQAWVTLTSAGEGTSDVTVYCPGVSPWEARTESCQVHWVDAQWSFPSVAIAESGGRQLLTTTVSRQSDCAPRGGWIVRYEIVEGPPAGFAPDGSQVVEIPTDGQGKAAVELFQQRSQAGTNKVSIQVIRPAGLGCPDQRIVIGRTCLAQTWSAPDLAVRVTGPAVGSVGSNLGFRVEVSNPGDMAAEGISLTTRMPAGLGLVSSSPVSEGVGGAPRWSIGRLAAGETRSIALDVRPDRAGQFELCAEAVAAGGLSVRGCANLAVEAAELKVEVQGPTEATVGESVTHRIVVTNASRVPATALILTDVRDAGLEHDIPTRKIETSLGDLQPMQFQEVTITFRAAEAGQQCHTVQVTGAGGLRADGRVCVEVREAAAPSPVQPAPSTPDWNEPEQPAPPSDPPPAALPRFEIDAYYAAEADQDTRITEANAGDNVLLILSVSSVDRQPLSGLTVAIETDGSLKPLEASEGYEPNGTLLIWRNQTIPLDTVGRFAVKCLCREPLPDVCFYASVTDANGEVQRRPVCIPISPASTMQPAPSEDPAPGLELRLSTTNNPASQGSTFSYLVSVRNIAPTDARNVELAVAFPAGLTAQQFRTYGHTKTKVRDNKMLAEKIPFLRANETAEYTIEVTAEEVGQYTVEAVAVSDGQRDGVIETDAIGVEY